MLVLSRKVGEKIVIGDNITLVVNRISGNRITLGIDAPAEVRVIRGELKPFTEAFDDADPDSRRDDRHGRPASKLDYSRASSVTRSAR